MRRIQPNAVEVDMIPMIDIISLLLMFLIVVGGAVERTKTVEMRLPRADQARPENNVITEGRIVVELDRKDGKFWAVINRKTYELLAGARNATLQEWLDDQVHWALEKGLAKREGLDGAVDTPVKLRIPEAAPMNEVERILVALSEAHLTNIQYASRPE